MAINKLIVMKSKKGNWKMDSKWDEYKNILDRNILSGMLKR